MEQLHIVVKQGKWGTRCQHSTIVKKRKIDCMWLTIDDDIIY